METVLKNWNGMTTEAAAEAVLPCCGSHAWAVALASQRPVPDEAALLAASDRIWSNLPETDWDEAFRSHPRIGETKAAGAATSVSLSWSKGEQSAAGDLNDEAIRQQLAQGNRTYEEKFRRIYIVCATGKSAREMLDVLNRRLHNDPATETCEAAEQQRQITHLRLRKWLRGE